MITYSNDSAILSFLMGKLYGCKNLIAGESAMVQMYSLFFCLLCFCMAVHESQVIHSNRNHLLNGSQTFHWFHSACEQPGKYIKMIRWKTGWKIFQQGENDLQWCYQNKGKEGWVKTAYCHLNSIYYNCLKSKYSWKTNNETSEQTIFLRIFSFTGGERLRKHGRHEQSFKIRGLFEQ